MIKEGINMCEYCNPPNPEICFSDLGKNLLGYDEEEIHIAINTYGELEINLDLETLEWDDYYGKYVRLKKERRVKINYCPMCGRKLKYKQIPELECKHIHTEETHPYGWAVCKDCGKLL